MAPVTGRLPWLVPDRQPVPGRVPGRALIRRTEDTGIPVLADPACAGHPDADKFFSEAAADRRAALAICATCPVRAACLEAAVARKERIGVWGGVDFEARKRRAARSPHAGKLSRGAQALKTAEELGELLGEHGTLRASAEAAGLSTETARFYLDLLDLDAASRELIRSGAITATEAVAAVRRGRRDRERAS